MTHLTDTSIYSVSEICDLHERGRIRLRPAANSHYESASDWYDSYGAHISTERAGDITVQAVDYDWLDDTDAAVAAKVRDADEDISADEADALVALARGIRDDADNIEGGLEAVVDAYERNDLDGVIDALRDVSSRESDHGDDPATVSLMRQLLDVTEDEE